MSEQVAPVKTPAEEDEEQRKRPEEVDELLDKMYKIMSDLGKTLESLATHISGAKEAQRGLIEAVGKMESKIESLAGEVQKLTVSLSQTFAEHKAGKYTEPGKGEGEASGVGEKVTVGDVREPGVDMLKGEVVKATPTVYTTATTPKPPSVANVKKAPDSKESELNEVIKSVIEGKMPLGQYGSELWKVIKR